MKHIIKKIVMSKTYRQSSKASNKIAESKDPNNLLLHRMSVRRLTAEAIRDSILKVSGRLDLKPHRGASIPVNHTPFMQGRGKSKSGPLDGNGKRSIYLGVRRNFLSPMMMVFMTWSYLMVPIMLPLSTMVTM